jgi:hypothetical protein
VFPSTAPIRSITQSARAPTCSGLGIITSRGAQRGFRLCADPHIDRSFIRVNRDRLRLHPRSRPARRFVLPAARGS